MHRRYTTSLIIFSLLTGCSTYLPSQPRFSSTILLPKGHLDGGDNKVVRTPTQYKSKITQPVPLSCEAAESTDATVKDRNSCIRELETDINGSFAEYQIQLQSDIAKTNSFLNITGIGLSAASTAAGGASAKTILSAIGTGIGGIRTSISEDFLFKSTIQTLSSQMVADRAKVATRIASAMKSDMDSYSIHDAYGDLLDYYYAGTLLSALQSVNADAGAKAASCSATAQAVSKGANATSATSSSTGANGPDNACGTVTFTYNYGTVGDQLDKIWQPDGTNFDIAAETKLKLCIEKLNISTDIATLIYGAPDSDKSRVLGCYQSN
jgi:hypothetical protein